MLAHQTFVRLMWSTNLNPDFLLKKLFQTRPSPLVLGLIVYINSFKLSTPPHAGSSTVGIALAV